MARILFNRPRPGSRVSALSLRTKAGGSVTLARPLRSGGLRKVDDAPFGWRNIAAVLGKEKQGQGTKAYKVTEPRINGWLLVLAAKKIPHRLFPLGTASRLYVSPLYEGVALQEIFAFEQERPTPLFVAPSREHAGLILAFFLLLLLWHGLRFHWFSFTLPVPPFPAMPQGWPSSFGLDVFRVRGLGEWWRCITALTLHADTEHLLGNCVFGLFFFVPLCRRAGVGFGLFLAVLAGVLGNGMNALIKDANVVSIGFSTALFGALGSLCALAAVDAVRFQAAQRGRGSAVTWRSLAPMVKRALFFTGAGLALLGFLGGGAEVRTDYAAHIWGFVAGLLIATLLYPLDIRLRRFSPRMENRLQAVLAALAVAIPVFGWLYAV